MSDATDLISAIADAATAGIAFYGFRRLLQVQNKLNPEHFSSWTTTSIQADLSVIVDVFAVNLLPEPAITRAIQAGPGMVIAFPPVDRRTAAQRHRDAHNGVADPQPRWDISLPVDRVLPGYRPEAEYQPIASIMVDNRSGGDMWLYLQFQLGTDAKRLVTRRVMLP